MSNKPLIIIGSARKQSDTKKLVNLVFSGIDNEQVDLLDYKITPFNYLAGYPPDDDFLKLVNLMLKHQKIVFATPVYWYSMSGIMKIFFDRLTDIATVRKETGRKLKGKQMYLVSVGTEEMLPDGFEVPFRLTAKYFDMDFVSGLYCAKKDLGKIEPDVLNFIDLMGNPHC